MKCSAHFCSDPLPPFLMPSKCLFGDLKMVSAATAAVPSGAPVEKSAEGAGAAHVVSAFAPEVSVKPVSSAAAAGSNKAALDKPSTIEVRRHGGQDVRS